MKKILIIVIFLISTSVMVGAEEIDLEDSFADKQSDYGTIVPQPFTISKELSEIIPSNEFWGQSKEEIKAELRNSKECIVGDEDALVLPEQTFSFFNMDAYYVFFNNRLYKSVYILSNDIMSKKEIIECKDALVDNMIQILGEHDSVTEAVTTWNKGSIKVEIGTGRFKKYKGTDTFTVGIVVTNVEYLKNEKMEIKESRHNAPYTVIYFETFIRNKEYIKIEFTGHNKGVVKLYDEKKRHDTDYGSFVGNLDIGLDIDFDLYQDPVKLKYSKAGDDSKIDWICSDGSVMRTLRKKK